MTSSLEEHHKVTVTFSPFISFTTSNTSPSSKAFSNQLASISPIESKERPPT
jgi:hypothetical protein